MKQALINSKPLAPFIHVGEWVEDKIRGRQRLKVGENRQYKAAYPLAVMIVVVTISALVYAIHMM